MCISNAEVKMYENLNAYANKHSVVILGSTFMYNVPITELRQSFKIHSEIYNRSLTDLRVDEAKPILEGIMTGMAPKKVVLQLGEVELKDENPDIDTLISQVNELIEVIRNSIKYCKIVLASVPNADNSSVKSDYNSRLEELSKATRCQFADISTGITKSESAYINAFMKLKFFLADDISEAFSFVTY